MWKKSVCPYVCAQMCVEERNVILILKYYYYFLAKSRLLETNNGYFIWSGSPNDCQYQEDAFCGHKILGEKFLPGRKSISYSLIREGCHCGEGCDICVWILPHFRIPFFFHGQQKCESMYMCRRIHPSSIWKNLANFSGLGVCLIFLIANYHIDFHPPN